ncbi:abnormal embryonic PARtitioning of cytoplasm family member (par-5) [Reticulomyxa filosa]|uniref:Abnormal embryonic PARtitioning of cytoplasm family member (Par-5) n=1 Tax=Reticulomyxa filosa TaxID=46433 RepID=X6PD90_RETFI|nr:abnormal embryonic PARtitioning of cytoplasm family member (par-5) [Reticulomyxa filosa]|eukprot:ETO36440.1 abnormal embryonic PARtitioning of cytoplasm family member (par-5) [Reticulomyxa filosa]
MNNSNKINFCCCNSNNFIVLIRTLDAPQLVELVRVAETAERYDDSYLSFFFDKKLCKFVKALVQNKTAKGQDLDVEERNLLSVAYKNVVGSKRASWRTLSGGFDDADEALIEKYKGIVENELENICKEVISLLVDNLLKTVTGKKDETEVFYLKMSGDYYRYLAEFRQSNDSYKEKSKEYYQKALDVAQDHLPETHPTRLVKNFLKNILYTFFKRCNIFQSILTNGLALNFSVCYYEILKQPEKACELAKKSFDAAIEKLDGLNDSNYKDSTLIMQLLRDNLTLWTSEQAVCVFLVERVNLFEDKPEKGWFEHKSCSVLQVVVVLPDFLGLFCRTCSCSTIFVGVFLIDRNLISVINDTFYDVSSTRVYFNARLSSSSNSVRSRFSAFAK